MYLTLPERLMSSEPTAATKEGMMRGRMRALSMRRNKFPTYDTYITSLSVHLAAKEEDERNEMISTTASGSR